jgi:hypothetical protein
MHQKTLEGTEPKWTSSCQVGLAGPTTMPPSPPYGILPCPSGVFFHHLLECISAIREVGLIQGLTVFP